MPDVSMCSGENCPLKNSCYRFTAKPSEYRQAYFMQVPYNHEEKKCDHYWGNKEE